MRLLGVGLLRWLAALLAGCVAAGFLFGLAALVAGATEAAAFGLLALGFGLAFFPVVFALGARRPRQVLRRAFLALAVEGLLILLVAAYPLVAGAQLVPPGSFGWVRALQGLGEAVAASAPAVTGVAGAVASALGILVFLMLREPGRAAPQASPSVAQKATPATPSPAGPALDDEDAQLMADLESLRKKLPQ